MLKTLSLLYKGQKYLFDEFSDTRTINFPLMRSPVPVLILLACYLKFVSDWGPKFMKDRKPYNIKNVIIVYNAIQMVFSGYVVVTGVRLTYGFGDYNIFCQAVDKSHTPSGLAVVNGVYFYFLVKVIDLLDTVFFVLRKKTSQITFLHLYHHMGMVIATWAAVKFLPGGHSTLLGIINSVVHICMYAYYLTTLIRNKQSVWWKKYITQLQIIQFLLIALHYMSLLIHPYCGYPKWVGVLMSIQNLFMLFMFVDFYYKAYIKKRPVRKTLNDCQENLYNNNNLK